MSYICVKKLSVGGKAYHPGETIPDEVFLDGRAGKLRAYGYIAEVAADTPMLTAQPGGMDGETGLVAEADTSATFCVTLEHDESGAGIAYPITGEQLQAAVNIMQKNANDAMAAIGEEVDETVLTFIVKVDSRKTVTQAATKQLAVISSVKGSDNPADQGGTPAAD